MHSGFGSPQLVSTSRHRPTHLIFAFFQITFDQSKVKNGVHCMQGCKRNEDNKDDQGKIDVGKLWQCTVECAKGSGFREKANKYMIAFGLVSVFFMMKYQWIRFFFL